MVWVISVSVLLLGVTQRSSAHSCTEKAGFQQIRAPNSCCRLATTHSCAHVRRGCDLSREALLLLQSKVTVVHDNDSKPLGAFFFLVCGTEHCKGVGGNQISQLLLSSCLEHGGEISYVRPCGFLDDTPEWLASLRGAVNRWTRVKETKWRQMLDFQPDVILPHGPKWGIITF